MNFDFETAGSASVLDHIFLISARADGKEAMPSYIEYQHLWTNIFFISSIHSHNDPPQQVLEY